jgi:glutathione peroxidase
MNEAAHRDFMGCIVAKFAVDVHGPFTSLCLAYDYLMRKRDGRADVEPNQGHYNTSMSTPIQQIPVRRITGEDTNLGEYSGKVLLIVNVASKCGLTKQYEALEKLYRDYRDRGLVVAGFPANDFRGQEPGTNDEIQNFCTSNFGVDFPLFEKITVVGDGKHPLYKELIAAQPTAVSTSEVPFSENLKKYGIEPNEEPELLWNFEKFIVDRRGKVTARFAPNTTPDDPALVKAVEAELAKG